MDGSYTGAIGGNLQVVNPVELEVAFLGGLLWVRVPIFILRIWYRSRYPLPLRFPLSSLLLPVYNERSAHIDL